MTPDELQWRLNRAARTQRVLQDALDQAKTYLAGGHTVETLAKIVQILDVLIKETL